jgi:hypothetical protein
MIVLVGGRRAEARHHVADEGRVRKRTSGTSEILADAEHDLVNAGREVAILPSRNYLVNNFFIFVDIATRVAPRLPFPARLALVKGNVAPHGLARADLHTRSLETRPAHSLAFAAAIC